MTNPQPEDARIATAREVYAAEFDRNGWRGPAADVRNNNLSASDERVLRAMLAFSTAERASETENAKLREALQSAVDALHLFLLATGGPSDIQTCSAILNGKMAHDEARSLLSTIPVNENSNG